MFSHWNLSLTLVSFDCVQLPRQETESARSSTSSSKRESLGKGVPPPIPRRGNIPGTLPDDEDNEDPGVPPLPSAASRRHTVSSLDRDRLSRTLSNGSESRSPQTSRLSKRDSDGYLLPWEDEELAQIILDRQAQAQGSANTGAVIIPPARGSTTSSG